MICRMRYSLRQREGFKGVLKSYVPIKRVNVLGRPHDPATRRDLSLLSHCAVTVPLTMTR